MFSNQTLLHTFTAITTASTVACVSLRQTGKRDLNPNEQTWREILEFVGITISTTSLCGSLFSAFQLVQYGQLVALGGMFIPGLVAHFLERKALPKTSVLETFREVFKKPVFLLAVVATPFVMAVTRLTSLLFPSVEYSPNSEYVMSFYNIPDEIREQTAHKLMRITEPLLRWLPLYSPLVAFGGGLINSIPCYGEEKGWRGYLLPRFRKLQFGFWTRSFLTGAIWGLWHIPFILNGHNYPHNPQIGCFLFIFICIFLSPFFTLSTENEKTEKVQQQVQSQQNYPVQQQPPLQNYPVQQPQYPRQSSLQSQLQSVQLNSQNLQKSQQLQQNSQNLQQILNLEEKYLFEGAIRAAILHGAFNACGQLSVVGLKGGSDLTVGITGFPGLIVLIALNLFVFLFSIFRRKKLD